MSKKTSVDHADAFARYWDMLAPLDAPRPERECEFAEGRRYRFDFAWPSCKLAVEVDGATLMIRRSPSTGKPVIVGRHNLDADRWKLNEAAAMGWRIIRFSPQMLKSDPQRCIDCVMRAIYFVVDN